MGTGIKDLHAMVRTLAFILSIGSNYIFQKSHSSSSMKIKYGSEDLTSPKHICWSAPRRGQENNLLYLELGQHGVETFLRQADIPPPVFIRSPLQTPSALGQQLKTPRFSSQDSSLVDLWGCFLELSR